MQSELSQQVRSDILTMLNKKGRGHYGGALSCVEILVTLYFHVMNNDDKFILSKAHSSITLYSVLVHKGILNKDILNTYGDEGSSLGVHAEVNLPGIEFSCGSLGHGLSYGAGLALAKKLKQEEGQIYVLLGDGECQEGSVWEAALFASQHKLNNLTVVLDYNKKQASGFVGNILNLSPLSERWEAFGWYVLETDGHDCNLLIDSFNFSNIINKPQIIIAHTIKGKGVKFLEDKEDCHYDKLSDEQVKEKGREL